MDRVQKAKINSITSLLNRVVILISGLIIPRLILVYYGSDVNGLTSSINQFLSVITFLDLGVGAVVQSVLYQPLARKDRRQVSLILSSARSFFTRIAYILIIYIVVLLFLFPKIAGGELNYVATAFLIIAMSINRFGQYYFGIVNELLLNADQKGYVQLISEIIVVILNTLVSVLLIINSHSIVTVKFFSGLIYLVRPIFLKIYVDRNYEIDYSIEVSEEPIKQKWNGAAQHIASVISNGIDIVLLTIFSTLENVSVYSIYNLVVSGVEMFLTSAVTGLQPLFGNLLANEEFDLLRTYFERVEWLVHKLVVYLFGMTALLITPFVMIYTQGVTDVNYYVPTFAVIFVIARAISSLKLPYFGLVKAAGHYKQTQNSSIIETVINIIISMLLVMRFDLIGVVIGTLIAMTYRLFYLAWYLSNNIIKTPIHHFVKNLLIDIFTFAAFLLIGFSFNVQVSSIIDWIYLAIFYGIIFALIMLAINLLFYKEMTVFYLRKMLGVSSN